MSKRDEYAFPKRGNSSGEHPYEEVLNLSTVVRSELKSAGARQSWKSAVQAREQQKLLFVAGRNANSKITSENRDFVLERGPRAYPRNPATPLPAYVLERLSGVWA